MSKYSMSTKRIRQMRLANINIQLMAKDLNIRPDLISSAIITPGYSETMNRLWHRPISVSNRCKKILTAMGDIRKDSLTQDQIAGLSLIARAAYLSINILQIEADHKNRTCYLAEFLMRPSLKNNHFFRSIFELELLKERRLFSNYIQNIKK